jgi:uncharacterized protein (DUF924 family)
VAAARFMSATRRTRKSANSSSSRGVRRRPMTRYASHRYPHRNAIVGRESTPEEIEFLKQPGSSF